MRIEDILGSVVKDGAIASRACWNGHYYIGLLLPDDRSDMDSAYFYLKSNIDDITIPWTPSMLEMTCHDWEIVSGE